MLPPQPSMGYHLPPGLPQGVQDRLPYQPQMPGPGYHMGLPSHGIPPNMLPSPQLAMSPNQQGGMLPQGLPPSQGGVPPGFAPHMMDDRMMDGAMMSPYPQG